MNTQFIQQSKIRLEKEKADLQKQLAALADQGGGEGAESKGNFPQYGFSTEDNALEVSNYQDNISVQRGLEDQLKQIEVALERMSKGQYGICENCGQEIPRERLDFFPAATRCMACSQAEK